MTYDKRKQAEEALRRRSEHDRLGHLERQAAARLKPFDWSDEHLGIRRKDVAVFKAAAGVFDLIILVRSTNPASLVYLDNQLEYCPKPLDCKVKTADRNVYLDAHSIRVQSAGLVVAPELLGPKAFDSSTKYDKSVEEWRKFTKANPEIRRYIFDRRGVHRGFFAVDLHPGPRYGCLMVCEQDVPDRYFDTVQKAFQTWKRTHMRYIHGDYDLYAVIDPRDTDVVKHKETRYGVDNIYSPRQKEVEEFVNRGIGAAMIQHGEQFLVIHQQDTLFVFTPAGSDFYFTEPDSSIEEIFRLLYHVTG